MDNAASQGDPLTFEALYAEPSMIGTLPVAPVWSPDGARLAFLWNDAGRRFREVWVHDVGAGTTRQVTHLAATAGATVPDGVAAVAWFGPDAFAFVLGGTLLASDAGGRVVAPAPGLGQVAAPVWSQAAGALAFLAAGALHVLRPGEAPLCVMPAATGVAVESFQWSRDGRALVFVECDSRPVRQVEIIYDFQGSRHRDIHARAFPGDALFRRRVGLVPAVGGDIRWFDRPDPEDAIWGYGVSPDGGAVFVSGSDLSIKTHTIRLYDMATGAASVFYRHHDPLKIRPDWQVDWAPGGDGLVLLTDRDGFNHLWHLPQDGGAPRQITEGAWEVAEFATDPAGTLYFTAARAHPAERQVHRVPFAGGEPECLTPAAGVHVPTFAPDFSRLADVFSHDRQPHELFVQPTGPGAEARRITRSPLPAFHARDWGEVRYPRFRSSVDGAELTARVILPVGYQEGRRYPLVVGSVYSDTVLNQWGGRQAHPVWGLDQYLAARGFVVANPEIRGSFGHGRDWNRPMLNSYGTMDIEDIADCVTHLADSGLVDPACVGIWGSSYGGLMTLMSLFKKPGFYAAGVAGAPATNVFHAYPEQSWIMGLPEGEDFPARYQAQSAYYHTEGLRDPLMIIHGTKDEVVLYADTMALVEKMVAQNKAFELVTLPGVGHAWAKHSAAVTRFAYGKLAAFFEAHLKPGTGEAGGGTG